MQNNFSNFITKMLTSTFAGGKQGEIATRTTTVSGEKYDYQIYLPPGAKTAEKLPLVTFLHGIRERGTGGFLKGMFATLVAQYLREVPAIVLFPQCRQNRYWADAQMDKMVMHEIGETKKEFAVDASREYLLGVSMGGYGVWHLAAAYPNRFAALVSICGGSPILSGDRFTPIAEKVGKTPAWLFHGADDPIVQVSESRGIVAALKAAGGDVKYSEYPGVGHNVWLNALNEKDLLPWMLRQKLGE